MRPLRFFHFAATLAVLASCAPAPDEPSSTSDGAIEEGVEVGAEGGGVRSGDAVLSVEIPPGALGEPVKIEIVHLDDESGARGTPLYRITMTPSVPLNAAAKLTFDLEKAKATAAAPAEAFGGLRLAASSASATAHPEIALQHPAKQKVSLTRITGATLDLEHVFGLMEAKPIACGNGETCNTCCIDVNEFTCSAVCATEPGKLAVDCLRDSDCGAGLKCCTPTTQRNGGVLRVDDTRITCQAECASEQNHVCDLDDPSRCATCTAARPGCSRGFCGDGRKTPVQLICP